jgi:periplasmic divalent cation tolerance protein
MENCKETDILSVTTTVGSRADAERLARALLDQRLAACVQLDDAVTSFYRWKGEVCVDAEVRLVIKTVPALREAVEDFLRANHPYELPQFAATTLSATGAYARWVAGEVAATGAAPARTPGR